MTKNFQAPLNSYNYRYSTVELSDVVPQLRGFKYDEENRTQSSIYRGEHQTRTPLDLESQSFMSEYPQT